MSIESPPERNDRANPMKAKMGRRGRDWTQLPDDVTAKILSNLGAFPILLKYQMVCKTWRRVSLNFPCIWRTIDIDFKNLSRKGLLRLDIKKLDIAKMYRNAIDRSRGQLIDITLGCYYSAINIVANDFDAWMKKYEITGCIKTSVTDDLLKYMVDSCNCSNIRRLHVIKCNITHEGLSGAASRFALLEELKISKVGSAVFGYETLQVIGRSCPLLKSLTCINYWTPSRCDDVSADAIAETMPGLKHLKLDNFVLTNDAVEKLVCSCQHLESLDLSEVFFHGSPEQIDQDLENRIIQQIENYKGRTRSFLLYA